MGLDKFVEDGGFITIGVKIPVSEFDKWNVQCKKEFSGIRWLKMKFDHEFREQFKPITSHVIVELEAITEEVADLRQKVYELEKVSQNQPKTALKQTKLSTLGGGVFER